MKIPRPATHSLPMRAAKVGADLALWGRVGARRTAEQALVPAAVRPLPEGIPGTAVLHSSAEVDAAVEQAQRLRLPLHPTRAKNWDVLGAVRAVLEHVGPDARVLDAGAARYSTVLPSLRLYGLTRLSGINLEFHRSTRRGVVEFRPGDITATGLPDASLDAVTCMSVIEHGVDVRAFLAESARILRPGGVLVISTDYDQSPPDTSHHTAYGQEVHIFGPAGDPRPGVGRRRARAAAAGRARPRARRAAGALAAATAWTTPSCCSPSCASEAASAHRAHRSHRSHATLRPSRSIRASASYGACTFTSLSK